MSPSLAAEVVDRINALPEEKQQRVLQFIRSLSTEEPWLFSGRELLRMAGTISPEDGAEMARAIEEGCERIDPNEW